MDARRRDIDALRGEVGDKDGALEELRQQRAVEQATEQVGAAVLAMRGSADEDIFGFEQTAETIRAGCVEGLSAEALIDRLIGAVQGFAGDTPQGDDMTCVVLRVNS